MSSKSWWHPDRHKDRRQTLLNRNSIKKALRRYFEGEGYTEVECNALQVSPGNEAHLHAFQTEFQSLTQKSTTRYLHTSPEFACKKLLAAGETKVFDFARVYRNGEISPTHAPEFTMLEWYQVGASFETIMQECAVLCQIAASTLNTDRFINKTRFCDINAEPEYLTLEDAFRRFADIPLRDCLNNTEAFKAAALKAGITVAPADSWSDVFSAVLVTRIEPHLGKDRLTFLYKYPACEAALAAHYPDDPEFAQRFELYACGVELANGFYELTDPIEQEQRFRSEMDLKEMLYGTRYPIDHDFLKALAEMPEACGVAMGFDRLVMLTTGAPNICDVQWTPWDTSN